MNEDEITRIVADALRDAWRTNNYSTQSDTDKALVRDVLYDVASNLANEIWPTKSEESPNMPEEWQRARYGE